MNDETTRRQWREHKRKWRAANRERNREIDRETYYLNRESINAKRKELRVLFAEWRQTLKTAEAPIATGLAE